MPYITREEAEALARSWQHGEVAPEDFDPAVGEWRLEEAVRSAVKEGDLHQNQFVEEVRRRTGSGRFGVETPAFEDRFPVKRRVEE